MDIKQFLDQDQKKDLLRLLTAGSVSDKDFAHFLNISRRSLFECANMIAILERNGVVDSQKKIELFEKLDHLSSMITNFRKRLTK